MHKIVHEKFEIDLSECKLSIIEQNNWYNDQFFTKFSFPSELHLSGELLRFFGPLLDDNSAEIETLFDVTYVHDGTMEKAVFEIEELVSDNVLSFSISFGFDEIQNFNKKLSELPLQKFDLAAGVSIYDFANTVIPQTWPAVNYNFPMVITDRYDTTQANWAYFEGIINKRSLTTGFQINEVVIEGLAEITKNRNVIQPMPYLFHVLQAGFSDAGFALKGDALNDNVLKKILLFADVDYAKTVELQSYYISAVSEQDVTSVYLGPNNLTMYFYHQELELQTKGKYIIVGSVYIKYTGAEHVYANVIIRINGEIIWSTAGAPFLAVGVTWAVNKIFETSIDTATDLITVESNQAPSEDQIIFDLEVLPIRLNDAYGNALPTVMNENRINLKQSVPDITFGDLLKWVKNKWNIDFEPRGNEMFMNFIEDQISYNADIDLSKFEVKNPKRKFNKGISFLLKFQEVNNKEFALSPVFHSAREISNLELHKDEKTQEIVINELPLPLFVKDEIRTAYAFERSESKIYTVIYDGLTAGQNVAQDPLPMLLDKVHELHWKKWFSSRINARPYGWNFKMTSEILRALKAKGKVFAYGRYHIVRNITKEQINPDLWEVSIETETLL